MKRILRLTESDLVRIIKKVIQEETNQLTDLNVSPEDYQEVDGCTADDFTNHPELGGLFKKIFGMDVAGLKRLYQEVKQKMRQKNEQAAATASVMILGVPVAYVLLGLVAFGILTALISKIGGGRRGGYSGGSNCRAIKRQRSRGQGIWRDVSL